jgi:hypothetical protein
MNRQIILLIIGFLIFLIGCFLRIYGNTVDGMAIMTAGLYLTIVWLIDSLLRLKRDVEKLRNEIKELKK